MKNQLLIALSICAAVSAQAQVAPTPTSETITNLLPGQEIVKVRLAPPLAVSPAAVLPQQPPTNGLSAGVTTEMGSTPERQIIPTASGAEATFGRHKVFFATDAAESRPVTLITPDNQKLSFRVSFLVLANRATGARSLGTEADVVHAPLLDRQLQIVLVVDAGVEEQVVLDVGVAWNPMVGR